MVRNFLGLLSCIKQQEVCLLNTVFFVELADMMHGVDGASASRQSSVTTAESLLVSLNSHRSERVATTLSDFPLIHWLNLFSLYSIILVSFWIDSNQGVLQYLNSLQVRALCLQAVLIIDIATKLV